MELHAISTSQLQSLESGKFITRFLDDFENQGIDATEDAEINYFYTTLKSQSPIYNKALMQVRGKAETVEIERLDEIRDRKVVTLRKAFKVHQYADHGSPEEAAYIALKPLFTTYKEVERMNLEAESLALEKLIEELRKPNYEAHANVLGLKNHINAIETANDNFQSKFGERSTSEITSEVYDVKQLRKDIFSVYKEASDYIEVMAKRKKTLYYTNILDTLNNGRRYYSDIIARRRGGGKA